MKISFLKFFYRLSIIFVFIGYLNSSPYIYITLNIIVIPVVIAQLDACHLG